MALGGGIWATQNKVLPGTYINVSSIAKASVTLSDRGIVAMPLLLDWGPDNEVFAVTNSDFQKNSLKVFGYAYTDDAMLPLRELFKYTQTLYAYRLNSGGTKAANTFCTAKYAGTVGNKLSTVITASTDDTDLFDVSTYLGTTLVDIQTVANGAGLTDNDFVNWKDGITLEVTAKIPLSGGANGTAENAAYQTALDKFESYSFNILGCPSKDATTVKLFVNYAKRMRDEVGANFQTVIYNAYGNASLGDHEGVIEVGNKPTTGDEFGLVYWVAGAEAACAVNKSNTNKRYDGELTVDVDYTQADLAAAIKGGRFMFHNVNGEIRVLEDINSLVTVSDTKGDVFKSNQTIRVCDQAANDITVLFNTQYLGIIPNDADGRIMLWNDICKIFQALESIRAIENFDPETVKVEPGETKKAVLCTVEGLNIVNAMAQLYMGIYIN